MNKFILTLSAIALFLTAIAQDYTDVSNLNDIEKKIIEKNKNVQTLQADFLQEKHMSILDNPFQSKGRFYYKKPDFVRWEYTSPFSYIVVLKQSEVIIKDGDDLQNFDMSNNSIFNEINKVMSGVVSGEMLENENFSKKGYENSSEYKIALTPTTNQIKEFLTEIHLIFNKETLLMNQIIMFEQGGDKTVIKMKELKSNQKIADEIFNSI